MHGVTFYPLPPQLDGWQPAAVHVIRPALDALPDGCPCWSCGDWCGEDQSGRHWPACRAWLRPTGSARSLGIVRILCLPCATAALIARYGDYRDIPADVRRLAGIR